MNILLSAKNMRAAEAWEAANGTASFDLMQRAGRALAQYVADHYPNRPVRVLCGPGNNGGDGFIAAQHLLTHGRTAVDVVLSGSKDALKGDAAEAAQAYHGAIYSLADAKPEGNRVIVDALFGTGLTRAIEGEAAAWIEALNQCGAPVISVDLPSGINSDTGEVMGIAVKATATITFGARKYAHLLMPGREYCGTLWLSDIGIRHAAFEGLEPCIQENGLDLWLAAWPWPKPMQHKYDRGHALVIGGGASRAGAAKLASLAALRSGAGLVTLVCAQGDLPVYGSSAMSIMTESLWNWDELMKDTRKGTVVIGPGAGVSKNTRGLVLSAIEAGKRMVLDADALVSFAGDASTLFTAIAKAKTPVILTPHAGEFAKLFPAIASKGSKLEQALGAAEQSGAVVIYKGFDTVIASPAGSARINSNAPPTLATAGAGDVLAGICTGLLAQGMTAFDAASAAVWLHAEAATLHGAGLIAEDLPSLLPTVLQRLRRDL